MAIVLENSVAFASLYLACLYLGAVAVPAHTGLHGDTIDYILRTSAPRLLVFSQATSDLIRIDDCAARQIRLLRVDSATSRDPAVPDVHSGDDSWSLDAALSAPPDDWRPFVGVASDDLLSITFTSGTTSRPKGVAHRISSLLGNAVTFNGALGLGPDDRFLHVFNMAYMAGFLNTLLSPLMAGASVVLERPFDARSMLRFWDSVIEYHVNTMWLAPTMLAGLLRVDRNPAGPEFSRKHVKNVLVGTAPLPTSTRRAFEDRYGVEILESYGLSESLLIASNSRSYPRLDGSVGRILPGVQIRAVDEHGTIAPAGVGGELEVRTPHMMAGYLDPTNFELDPIDSGAWFPTGDIGHLNDDGHLFISDRKKDLIIRGGMNLSPMAIEEVLLDHESVAAVAVVGLPHEFYGEEVVAVIKFKPGHGLEDSRAGLKALCNERLNNISVPSRFVQVGEIPMSVTGKVQKGRLREELLRSRAAGTAT